MQRFQVHSHSQALTPTYRSLQPVASTSVQPYGQGQTTPFIGGESVLIGSIFDVFSH